jgi:hypothetical protein
MDSCGMKCPVCSCDPEPLSCEPREELGCYNSLPLRFIAESDPSQSDPEHAQDDHYGHIPGCF